MTPQEIVNSLSKRGINLSYKDGSINLWPINKVRPDEIQYIKTSKAEVIYYLQGRFELKKSAPVITPEGPATVFELYLSENRLGVTLGNSPTRFYKLDEVSSFDQFTFLKRRIHEIENAYYSCPTDQRVQIFNQIQGEWHYLFKELNRQQFQIEFWCGPLQKGQSRGRRLA